MERKSSMDGYKAFNEDYTNIKNEKMVILKRYHTDGKIKYGVNGFHFALNMEDTIRYTDPIKGDYLHRPIIAKVEAFGEIDYGYDDYYGYYDLYAASDIIIKKYLSYNEIIEMALCLPEYRMKRFVSIYKLDDKELALFYNLYNSVDEVLDYYQRNMENRYTKKLCNK